MGELFFATVRYYIEYCIVRIDTIPRRVLYDIEYSTTIRCCDTVYRVLDEYGTARTMQHCGTIYVRLDIILLVVVE